jgi:thiol:disulfide interchange protein DsbD
MRRLPLLLLVVGSIVVSTLVTVSPARSAEDPLWYTSVDEAREAARASGRQILVDLYADWCIWCDKLDQIVFSRETFRETVGARYVFLRVDVEQEEGEELQRRFRATNLPTTLLMTPDRIEIGRIQGFFPLDPFLDQIERQEQGWRDFQARYEAEVAVDDRDTLVLLATNLYDRGDGLRSAAIYRRLLPETTPGSGERARLAYQIAEALRRGGDLEAAETAFVQAEGAVRAASLEDSDLAARLSLLRFHIDHDRGECKAAVSSLERFLDRYPENRLAPPARTTLHKLKQSESCA